MCPHLSALGTQLVKTCAGHVHAASVPSSSYFLCSEGLVSLVSSTLSGSDTFTVFCFVGFPKACDIPLSKVLYIESNMKSELICRLWSPVSKKTIRLSKLWNLTSERHNSYYYMC